MINGSASLSRKGARFTDVLAGGSIAANGDNFPVLQNDWNLGALVINPTTYSASVPLVQIPAGWNFSIQGLLTLADVGTATLDDYLNVRLYNTDIASSGSNTLAGPKIFQLYNGTYYGLVTWAVVNPRRPFDGTLCSNFSPVVNYSGSGSPTIKVHYTVEAWRAF